MRKGALLSFLLSFLLAAAGVVSGAPAERILRFHSDIEIGLDGGVTVRETIRVSAAGQKIKRGIYREFPTVYRDRFNNRVTVGFTVLEVLRDGRAEPYHMKPAPNGKRVYIGRSDVFLEPGEYTYTFVYRTDRQIGFFEDFDEIYWNVTGNGWEFAIDEASAVVRLPPGAAALDYVAFTGPQGAKGDDWSGRTEGEGRVRFAATRPLVPREGLTVAVSWPKGILVEPGWEERGRAYLFDNPSSSAALGGLLLLFVYYGFAWLKVGRDPPRGVIVPQYAPPEGFSPAAARYVMKMGYSDRVFAAAVVSMAARGHLAIEKIKDVYTLRRQGAGKSAKLSSGERGISAALFASASEIELKQKNHSRVGAAVSALKKSLRTDFAKLYFSLNAAWLLPGALLSILTLAAVVLVSGHAGELGGLALWLGLWTLGCSALLAGAVKGWKAVLGGGGRGAFMGAVFLTLFGLPFFIAEVVVLGVFAARTSPAAALVLLVLVLVNLLFAWLIKSPTLEGRRVMDRLEGFRMYLEAAEQDRLDRMHPPEKSPELFEKYLPFALALDVENAWAEQFSGLLASSSEGGEGGYRPTWYSGEGYGRGFSPGSFASSLGSSLSSAISSSSTAPGSRSGGGGFSGGGSSGGGGGGGGGGGW
jgi:hypothetical protein